MITLKRISLNSSHITVTDRDVRDKLKEGAWLFLNAAYKWVPGGFLSFSDEEALLNRSTVWYIIYDGEAPTPEYIDWQHVYGMTVYRQRFGLKAVAFAKQALPKPGTTPYMNNDGKEVVQYTMETETNNDSALAVDFRKRREDAVKTMMIDACKRGWCEVSGKPEEILLASGATMIPAQRLLDSHVYSRKQLTICEDGYHYIRDIGGQPHMKIALGNGFRG